MVIDAVIGLILKLAYKLICCLKKCNYIVPVDTKEDYIVKQNVLSNFLSAIADLLCVLLVFWGMNQRVLSYVSVMTIAMYTFSEHFKIYVSQKEKINSKEWQTLVRKKEPRYWKTYTPNLKYLLIAGISFVALFFCLISEVINLFEVKYYFVYYIFVSGVLVILFYIRIKNYFLDTFCVKEFDFVIRKKRG